jgi:hypothetical protein
MGYIINRYSGAILTTVEDGTVNLTTEVKLIGKNFAGYGEAQNENFLHLMESFANPTPPGKPLSGMIWYDSTVNKIKFYDGVRWRTTGSAEVSAVQPIGNVEGDFWWSSATNQLYTRSAEGEWVLIGPQTTALGTTQFVSREVLDNTNVSRSIIEAVLSDGITESTPLIIAESDFTIAPGEIDDTNFTTTGLVKKGITLADTDADGVSTNSIVWGTASNALRLGGLLPSDFIKSDDLSFDGEILISDVVLIGSDNQDGIIQNVADQTLIFKVNDGTELQKILTINLTGLIPGNDLTYDIGQGTINAFGNGDLTDQNRKWWRNIFADKFIGESSRSNTLRIVSDGFPDDPDFPSYRSAKRGPVANSIAARTAVDEMINNQVITAGALKATFFVGRATTAQYADLAEKYTVEQEWPVGTAMAVCAHEDHETGPAGASSIAIGVISENPAYLMNSESEGQAIALKGRVPVRVTGAVRKGQAIYAWDNGVCSTIATSALIGVALESNDNQEEKLVECVLKV